MKHHIDHSVPNRPSFALNLQAGPSRAESVVQGIVALAGLVSICLAATPMFDAQPRAQFVNRSFDQPVVHQVVGAAVLVPAPGITRTQEQFIPIPTRPSA